MPTLPDIKLDGTRHINIYSQGKTPLGRMLSNFFRFRFTCEDGTFESVEGYWHWLGIKECQEKDVLKHMYGYEAKKTGEELKRRIGKHHVDRFCEKVLGAIWLKIKSSTQYFGDTRLNSLPLEHYYNFSGKIIDVKTKYLWLIDGIDEMRRSAIHGREFTAAAFLAAYAIKSRPGAKSVFEDISFDDV